MMLSRLLIVPGVEHALQIIGVNLRSFVLSYTMNEPGIL